MAAATAKSSVGNKVNYYPIYTFRQILNTAVNNFALFSYLLSVLLMQLSQMDVWLFQRCHVLFAS
jgi:hypothetical protein